MGEGIGVILGVPVGVTVPPGVGDPVGVTDGDGTAVFVAVGETRIAVK